MSSTRVGQCVRPPRNSKKYLFLTPPKCGVLFILKNFTSKFYALPKIVLDKTLNAMYNISILKIKTLPSIIRSLYLLKVSPNIVKSYWSLISETVMKAYLFPSFEVLSFISRIEPTISVSYTHLTLPTKA